MGSCAGWWTRWMWLKFRNCRGKLLTNPDWKISCWFVLVPTWKIAAWKYANVYAEESKHTKNGIGFDSLHPLHLALPHVSKPTIHSGTGQIRYGWLGSIISNVSCPFFQDWRRDSWIGVVWDPWLWRQPKTVDEQVAKRYGSPVWRHLGQVKPSGQRIRSRNLAQASSWGKTCWNSGKLVGFLVCP